LTLAQIVYIYRTKRLHSSNYLFSTQVTLISTQVLCSIKTTLSPPITLTQTQPTSNPSTPNSPYYSHSHIYSQLKSLVLSQILKPLQLSLSTAHSPPTVSHSHLATVVQFTSQGGRLPCVEVHKARFFAALSSFPGGDVQHVWRRVAGKKRKRRCGLQTTLTLI
jgi:hypothetical protein